MDDDMSAHNDFFMEKGKIDDIVNQGYMITKVTESVDGARVEFKKLNPDKTELLHVRNADARKYFSSIIIKQQKERKAE